MLMLKRQWTFEDLERSTPGEPRPEILDQRLEWTPEGATDSLAIDLAAYFSRVLDV